MKIEFKISDQVGIKVSMNSIRISSGGYRALSTAVSSSGVIGKAAVTEIINENSVQTALSSEESI